MPDLRRRRLIALLGSMAAAWPLAARAQQRAKPPRIGFLGLAFERTAGEWLQMGLGDLGYIEGTNLIIEWQWAQKVDELPALVADLVRTDVDVIFAPSSTFVEAARHQIADGRKDYWYRPGGSLCCDRSRGGPPAAGSSCRFDERATD
jgi:putative ABC transport system substrate-binding protein